MQTDTSPDHTAPLSDLSSASTCPLAYRYGPAAFRTAQTDRVHTAYVIGGLYGNTFALDAIEAMRQSEVANGTEVTLVFNGDFNWFDTDEASFRRVNQAALSGLSIRGNVEAELASAMDEDCGCNYPDYVNAEYTARSNAIMRTLRGRAHQHPDLLDALQQLPFIRVLEIGSSRIGIVHGDAHSLSGWQFAAERLSATGKCCSGDQAPVELTPLTVLQDCFRQAQVRAFASTHTCLPHVRDLQVDGKDCVIINNGAAGMPNFTGTQFGIITRISCSTEIPANSLYGLEIDGVRFDALPVHFDSLAWLEHFERNWPPGSPAHQAYFDRMTNGPDFERSDALGGRLSALTEQA